MKKLIYTLLTIILFVITIASFDMILSNTIYKTMNNCYKYERYYYELKKNCSGKERFKKSFPIVDIYTDENGLRVGKNYNGRDKNKKNILIFGDSFTYGVGIKYEETYVGLIERKLSNFNIYNYAVGSYSPKVHLFKLSQSIEKNIRPNKIIVFLDFTDVIDEISRWGYENDKKTPKLKTDEMYLRSKDSINFKQKNFKLLTDLSNNTNYYSRILRSKIENNFKKNGNKEIRIKKSIQAQFTYVNKMDLDKRFWKKGDFEKGLNEIRLRIHDMQKIAQSVSSEFYIVVYPWAETLQYGQNEFNWSNFAMNLCVIKNCKSIDAYNEFNKYKKNNVNWNNQLYFVGDEHFNTSGAKLLSQTIIDGLKL